MTSPSFKISLAFLSVFLIAASVIVFLSGCTGAAGRNSGPSTTQRGSY